MLPIDYQAYVATRTIGEAVTRNPDSDFATVAAFVHGPELQLAPFKGIKQQFRPWDGQFRQPIIIATDKVPGLLLAAARLSACEPPRDRGRYARHRRARKRVQDVSGGARRGSALRRRRGDDIALIVQNRNVIALQDGVDLAPRSRR